MIESAGVAFIVRPQVSTTQTTIFTLFIRCLPVLLLPIVTAYIAGIIIWALVSTKDRHQTDYRRLDDSSVVVDDEDGNGLELNNNNKKKQAIFSSFQAVS